MKILRLILLASIAAVSAFFPLPVLLGLELDSLTPILGNQSIGQLENGVDMVVAQAPGPGIDGPHSTLALAASRTRRPDILRGFKLYRSGWDITNRHYWASVGFTGAAGFIVAALWFTTFGFLIIAHHFCRWTINIRDIWSSRLQMCCLILLFIFTCISVVGCIFLSIGQVHFRSDALQTLRYVVNQSDYTVQTLKNVSQFLSLAKTVNVAQVFLPSDVKEDIDKLNVDLNTSADTLTEKTSENSRKIKRVFTTMRSALITVTTVMLFVSALGLFLSAFEHRHAIHIFIVGGWLLVSITCILCGIFVILNNAICDTCLAMEEWVENPHAETALSSILPCVDPRTTNHTLIQSQKVVTNIVNVVNQVIYTVVNTDPPRNDPKYYNQSGPSIPPLCYPFDGGQCGALDVSIANASEVWKKYGCDESESGMCRDEGRVSGSMYEQLAGAVNVSHALEHYTPPLLSLRDCNFVRQTFNQITATHCPRLEKEVRIMNLGFGLISAGVSLCLVVWLLHSSYLRRKQGNNISAGSPTEYQHMSVVIVK